MEPTTEIRLDLAQFVLQTLGNSTATGLNKMSHFYRYEPGEEFKRHRDDSYVRNNLEAS